MASLSDFLSSINSSLIPSISRRASSFKKAALDRLLSFTSTGSQEEPINNANPEEPVLPQVAPTASASEMETIRPPASSSTNDTAADVESTTAVVEQEFRKTVTTVALGVLGFSFTLMVNKLPEDHIFLVPAHNSAVLISFILGGFLLLSSLRTTSSDNMRILQQKMMILAVIFLCVSFLLRCFAVSPTRSLPLEWVFFFVFLGALALYLLLTSRGHGRVPDPLSAIL